MNIYQRLNKTFFNSCSRIDKYWQKRKRTIDTKLIVLFLMKIISGKNNHGYAYIINEIWDDCIREEIPLPQYNPISASSMCEARIKFEQDYYKIKDFNDLYHQRWEIEELYKLSKSILCIEDFHSHNEKGVKQELRAHILLINLTRISENYFNHRNYDDEGSRINNKESRDKKQKLSSKNCLFFVVKYLPQLIQGKLKKHLK
ncbi:hypothetical protein Xvie_03261 [Xenorhabdus vietnamensis]|uniref:Transposase IS4-like domain-containing protein n=1 Tax=Xenorhabdus vietnamensis TaxID=351656 RepID=A0A1Y2SAV5_9GAMM|nr:transposase [Xenorhabdus vietnamensis]OTA14858.1 hypothetical protein Xvie_03261 [Xenorhabdus vietnamensis]